MDRCALMIRSGLTLFLAAAACGTGATQGRSDPELIAYGGPASHGRAALTTPPTTPPTTESVARLPDEVLRDPQQRMTAMLQLRRQIVFQTRGVADDRYRNVVRPSIARQLMAAGFEPSDAEHILSDVDYSRHQRE